MLTFKGSKSKKDVESKGFNQIAHYGMGRNVCKNDTEATQFVQHLIVKDVLMENLRSMNDKFSTPFILREREHKWYKMENYKSS